MTLTPKLHPRRSDEINCLVEVCYRQYPALKAAVDHKQIPSLVGHDDTHKHGHLTPKHVAARVERAG